MANKCYRVSLNEALITRTSIRREICGCKSRERQIWALLGDRDSNAPLTVCVFCLDGACLGLWRGFASRYDDEAAVKLHRQNCDS